MANNTESTLAYILQKLRSTGNVESSMLIEIIASIEALTARVVVLESTVSSLNENGKIYGADAYILPRAPEAPKPGDLWYNLNDVNNNTSGAIT